MGHSNLYKIHWPLCDFWHKSHSDPTQMDTQWKNVAQMGKVTITLYNLNRCQRLSKSRSPLGFCNSTQVKVANPKSQGIEEVTRMLNRTLNIGTWLIKAPIKQKALILIGCLFIYNVFSYSGLWFIYNITRIYAICVRYIYVSHIYIATKREFRESLARSWKWKSP